MKLKVFLNFLYLLLFLTFVEEEVSIPDVDFASLGASRFVVASVTTGGASGIGAGAGGGILGV